MNTLKKITNLPSIIMVVLLNIFFTVQAFAQDKKIDVDISAGSKGGGMGFFGQWYFWVGLGVFVIIIVAIISASKKSK